MGITDGVMVGALVCEDASRGGTMTGLEHPPIIDMIMMAASGQAPKRIRLSTNIYRHFHVEDMSRAHFFIPADSWLSL